MTPQPISTAPVGTHILVYLPPQAAHQVPWWLQAIKTDGDLYDETGSIIDCATHWLPLPEPPKPKQAYVMVAVGEILQAGDEVWGVSTQDWVPMVPGVAGQPLTLTSVPVRRKLPTPNPES